MSHLDVDAIVCSHRSMVNEIFLHTPSSVVILHGGRTSLHFKVKTYTLEHYG